MRSKIYMLCFFLSSPFLPVNHLYAHAIGRMAVIGHDQEKVYGKVTDANNQPLSGVTIKVKNSPMTVSTDAEGNFELLGQLQDKTLLLTYVGYVPKEVLVQNNAALQIILEADKNDLEEVVVVGYGTQKRKELTGSISSVKAADIEKVSSNSFTGAIQGKVPGVTITQTSGAPGGSSSVRIRGVGTTGGNQPLYVIDGFPVGEQHGHQW